MGVKKFNKDVVAAGVEATTGLIRGVTSVKQGACDGEVTITYAHNNLPLPLTVHAIIEGGENTINSICNLSVLRHEPLTQDGRCRRIS